MKNINWKLVIGLSLLGLTIALLTTFGIITMQVEQIIWIVVLLLNSFLVAKMCNSGYFLNGFMISIANCVWITSIHVLLMDQYLANNPDYMTMLKDMWYSTRPRVMALWMGPLIGIVIGIVQGLLSLGISKF